MAGPEMHYLNNGWLELESDPGLFTLLLEEFGCKGVQVEEIYDLTKLNLIDDHVFGFIFLFKWVEERRSRHRQSSSSAVSANINQASGSGTNTVADNLQTSGNPFYVEDEQLVNSIFFAHQITPNSCATHALLSVLLNCKNVDLGENLNKLRENTKLMNPENKGIAIGNIPELAKAHNIHAARSDILEKYDKSNLIRGNGLSRSTASDSFHFVSFVPINNRVYELDGLKKYPIDHGPIGTNERFSEKFRQIIMQRIPQQNSDQNSDDIRYSLMAVVPDRRIATMKKLHVLKQNRQFLIETVQTMCRPVGLPRPYDFHNYCKYPEFSCKTLFEIRSESCNVKKLPENDVPDKESTDLDSDADPGSPHSTGSSTDTSSEIGSEFNSPVGSYKEDEAETDKRFQTLFTFKFTTQMPDLEQKMETEKETPKQSVPEVESQFKENTENEGKIDTEKLISFYKKYAPSDLIKLLGKIQTEIDQTQKDLTDEEDKRTKFRVDDARRTHDYDDFISTFLLMLTEQKKLPELLEKELRNGKGAAAQSNAQVNDTSAMKDVASAFFEEIANDYEALLLNKKSSDSNISWSEDGKGGKTKKIVSDCKTTTSSAVQNKLDGKPVPKNQDKIEIQSPVKMVPNKTLPVKVVPFKSESEDCKLDHQDAKSKSTLLENEDILAEDSSGLRRTARKRTPKYTDPNYEFPGRAKRTNFS